jgi:hypothetical protein
MRIDWVPFSASALVAGATALSVGAVLTPQAESASDTLRVVQEEGGRWMAVAVLYFFASAAMTIGLPCIVTLFDRKGLRTGLAAVAVFTFGAIGIAGLSFLLAFIHALVDAGSITADSFDAAASETGFLVFLYGWIGAFYLGELLLAIALLRARSVPRWIPWLLIAHIATLPLGPLLPEWLSPLTSLMITVAFAGIGIAANTRHSRLTLA